MAEQMRRVIEIGSRVLVTWADEDELPWAGEVVNIVHSGRGTIVEVCDDNWGDTVVCSPSNVTLLDTPDLTDAVAVTDWLDA